MLVLSILDGPIFLAPSELAAIDLIECRLDLMPNFKPENLYQYPKPVIFTLRHHCHGGGFEGSIEALCAAILDYCKYHPAYIDLDCRLPLSLFQTIRQNFPKIKIIASYHQFEADVSKLSPYLQGAVDCDLLKIAMYCDHAEDVLDLFSLKSPKPLSLIPMGEFANFGRIIAKIIGNNLDYVALTPETKTAAGHLSLDELINLYQYPKLNANTKIYALLATHVSRSVGHRFHNAYVHARQKNAVYVKIEQGKDGFHALLAKLLAFPFYGLSLSMPLKLAFQEGLVVNTLVRNHNQWLPFNTDGEAVAELLDIKPGTTILILGSGGAAQGIAEALVFRGAGIHYLARNGGDYGFEDELPQFEVIINTLPAAAFDERRWFESQLKKVLVGADKILDIIYHEQTLVQQLAIALALPFYSGLQMFEAQALLQQDLWQLRGS